MLLAISSIILAINLSGCTNDEEELNQSMIITEDVQLDTEPKLKVLSNETIYFEEPLFWHTYWMSFDEENNIEVNYVDLSGDRSTYEVSKVLVEGDEARLEYLDTEKNYCNRDNIAFNIKEIDDSTYLIDKYDKYEIAKEMIDNESSFYFIKGSILLEYENVYAFLEENKMNWTDLESGESGTVNIPYQNTGLWNINLLEDKLFLSTRTNQETLNDDTLLIIDLKENKIENTIKLGEFTRIFPIDNERVVFVSIDGSDSALEIYNISNNTRKELIKYENPGRELGKPYKEIYELNQFSNREKIYYVEINMDKLYVKVAAIDGMDLEEAIVIYESDFDSTGSNSEIPNIRISEDEMEMVIYNHNIETNSIEKFNKVKLNK